MLRYQEQQQRQQHSQDSEVQDDRRGSRNKDGRSATEGQAEKRSMYPTGFVGRFILRWSVREMLLTEASLRVDSNSAPSAAGPRDQCDAHLQGRRPDRVQVWERPSAVPPLLNRLTRD